MCKHLEKNYYTFNLFLIFRSLPVKAWTPGPVRTRALAAIETYNNIHTVHSESSGVKLTRLEIEGWLELIC